MVGASVCVCVCVCVCVLDQRWGACTFRKVSFQTCYQLIGENIPIN